MMKAAAPSVGGDNVAPMPAAESSPPPTWGGYPERLSIGQASEATVTVVATPEPDTVPSRKPEATTARPGDAGDGVLPNSAKAQSMKKRPAPPRSSTAP